MRREDVKRYLMRGRSKRKKNKLRRILSGFITVVKMRNNRVKAKKLKSTVLIDDTLGGSIRTQYFPAECVSGRQFHYHSVHTGEMLCHKQENRSKNNLNEEHAIGNTSNRMNLMFLRHVYRMIAHLNSGNMITQIRDMKS